MFLKMFRLLTFLFVFSCSLQNIAQNVDVYSIQDVTEIETTLDQHAICGLTTDSENFWLATAESKIYKISHNKREIVDSLNITVNYITGITLVNKTLYGIDVENKMLCKFDTASGELSGQIALPFGSPGSFPAGMNWNGEYLYINHINTIDSVYVLDTSGAKIDGWISPVSTPTGIIRGVNSYWYIDAEELKIRVFDIELNIQTKEIAVPGGGFPTGLVFGDHSLWLLDNATDALYKIDTVLGIVTDTIILFNSIITGSDNNIRTTTNSPLMVYPCPATDFISLNLENVLEPIGYSIYSLRGELLQSGFLENKNGQINIKELDSGMYIVNLEEKNNCLSTMFFKK